MNRPIGILGVFVYITLLLFSLFFFVERTGFMDLSYHLFALLQSGEFAIQNNRFVASLTQIFPLMGAKWGFSLSSVMKLYSLSFVLLNAAVFFVLCFVLKSWRFGLAMILLNTLMVTHTFYWAQSELQQGLPLLILFFGLLDYQLRAKPKAHLMYVCQAFSNILMLVLVFSHPVIFIPAVFLYAFFTLRNWDNKAFYLYSMAAFLALLFIKSTFFKTDYDSEASESAMNLINFFPNYFTHQSNYNFARYILNDYYFLAIGAALISLFYLYQKRFLSLTLCGGFFIAYLLLVNMSYPGGEQQFYLENLYLPLTFFIAFPIAFDLADQFSSKLVVPILALVVVIRLCDIYYTHHFYSDRLDYVMGMVDTAFEEGKTKQLLQQTDEHKEKMLMTWASSYETWLLSTYKYGESASLLITDDIESKKYILNYQDKFSVKWGDFNYSDLPQDYFIFKDRSKYILRQ